MGCFVKNWLCYIFMLECIIVYISVNDNVILIKVKLYKEVYLKYIIYCGWLIFGIFYKILNLIFN